MTKQSEKIDWREAFRLVALALDGRLTPEEITKSFGGKKFKSYTEAAKGHSVSVATVRHTWKPNGMPSVGRRGSGSEIDAAESLNWRESRKAKNEESRGSNEFTARKRDAETRAAEADARIKERKAEVAEGQYVALAVAVSVVKGCANALRDGLMGVSRKLAPMFPAKYAAQWTADVEREHRNLLTAFSETSIADLRQAANERDEDDGKN